MLKHVSDTMSKAKPGVDRTNQCISVLLDGFTFAPRELKLEQYIALYVEATYIEKLHCTIPYCNTISLPVITDHMVYLLACLE